MSTATDPATERAPADPIDSTAPEAEPPDAPLSDQPIPLSQFSEVMQFALRNRVLANINSALAKNRMPTLDPDTVVISPANAEIVQRRYREIWRQSGTYDLQMEHHIQGLLATGGPGTQVLDTSRWTGRINNRRVVDEIGKALGRGVRKDRGKGRAKVEWRQEGPNQIRFVAFEPGDDPQLDTLRDQRDQHLATVTPRALQGLAVFFRKGK